MKENIFEVRTPEQNIFVAKGIETEDGHYFLEFAHGKKIERVDAAQFIGKCIVFHRQGQAAR